MRHSVLCLALAVLLAPGPGSAGRTGKKEYFRSLAADFKVVGVADVAAILSGPASLRVRDPSGRVTSPAERQIPGSNYVVMDFTTSPGDGVPDQGLTVPRGAEEGVYEVSAVPAPGADPEARVIVEIYVKGAAVWLVDDLKVKDLADTSFAVEVRNRPPEIHSAIPSGFDAGKENRVTVYASDYEGQRVTVHIEKGPAGMSWDQETWTLAWTPTLDDLGPHEVALVAEDERGATSRMQSPVWVLLPAVPSFRARVEGGAVVLTWEPLEGAVSYEILSAERGMLDPVATGLTGTRYVDIQVQVGQRYSYHIHGIDRNGRKSTNSPFQFVTVTRARGGPGGDHGP